MVSTSRMHYSGAGLKIKGILDVEEIVCSEELYQKLLGLLSKICSYEEEEVKIRPNLFLGKNIKEAMKLFPRDEFEMIKIASGELSGSDMMKILKPILPLCNNGWIVYLDLNDKENCIDYGVLRSFGLTSLPMTEMLFEVSDGESEPAGKAFGCLAHFTVVGKSEIMIRGFRTEPHIIDLRFHHVENDEDHTFAIEGLCNDMLLDLDNPDFRGEAMLVLKKLLRLTAQKVHGTICVVIRSTCNVSDIELFKNDNLVFPTPVSLVEFAMEALRNGSSSSVEKYYAVSGMFLEMMNVDGVTIIDTSGKIRAFNVFVQSSENSIQGGARRRAAETIKNSGDKNVIGVYFQSQDGNAFYWRNEL